MFSDILTPLPALGIEFDVVRGSGPIIEVPIRRLVPGTMSRAITTQHQQSRLHADVTH